MCLNAHREPKMHPFSGTSCTDTSHTCSAADLWFGVPFAALAEACDLGRGQGEAINKHQHGRAVFNSENCAISFKRGGEGSGEERGGAEAAANQDREVSSAHLFSLRFTETGFVILVFVCRLCGKGMSHDALSGRKQSIVLANSYAASLF